MATRRANRRSDISRGLRIRDKLIALLTDNKTHFKLKSVPVDNVVKSISADVRPPVIYVNLTGKPTSQPRTLGRHSTSYFDVYVVAITYIHSQIDKRVEDQLIIAQDVLCEFFEEHSSLDGLCNYGLEVHDAAITNFMTEKNVYNAVVMDLIIPRTARRNRDS